MQAAYSLSLLTLECTDFNLQTIELGIKGFHCRGRLCGALDLHRRILCE